MRKFVLLLLLAGGFLVWSKNFVASGNFQKLLDRHPHPVWGLRAQYALAQFYYICSDYENAQTGFNKVVTIYPKSDHAENSAYLRAVCLENQSRPSQAAQEYRAFLEAYPKSSRVKIVRKRLEILGI